MLGNVNPHSQASAVTLVSEITATLSGAGSLLVMLSYMLFKEQRNRSQQLLFFLSFADFVQAWFFSPLFIGALDISNMTNCRIQAAVGLLSAPASFFWTMCIAFYVNQIIRHVHLGASREKWMVVAFHVLCWGYPTVCLVVMFTTDPGAVEREADTSRWCGIPYRKTVWRMLFIFGPLFVSMLATTAFYLHSRRVLGGRQLTLKTARHYKLIFIPLIFVVLRIWGALYFFLNLSSEGSRDSETYMFAILLLRAIGDPGQGLFNSFVFVVFNRKVRTRFQNLILCRSAAGESDEDARLLHSAINTDNSRTQSEDFVA